MREATAGTRASSRVPWIMPGAAFAWVSALSVWAWTSPASFQAALEWAAMGPERPMARALLSYWTVFPVTEALAAFASLSLAFLALGRPLPLPDRVLALASVPAGAWVALAALPAGAGLLSGPSALGGAAVGVRCMDAILRRRGTLPRWLFALGILILAHGLSGREGWTLLLSGACVGLGGSALAEAGRRARRAARLWLLEHEIRREERIREKVDLLLARIGREGMDRLTPAERRFLYRASRFYRLSRAELSSAGREERPFVQTPGDPLQRPR